MAGTSARRRASRFSPAVTNSLATRIRIDATRYVAIGVGMVRNARVTGQNNCRLIASATEWAVPGRMMNWRSPFGSLL